LATEPLIGVMRAYLGFFSMDVAALGEVVAVVERRAGVGYGKGEEELGPRGLGGAAVVRVDEHRPRAAIEGDVARVHLRVKGRVGHVEVVEEEVTAWAEALEHLGVGVRAVEREEGADVLSWLSRRGRLRAPP
jgi:hypothetical protein